MRALPSILSFFGNKFNKSTKVRFYLSYGRTVMPNIETCIVPFNLLKHTLCPVKQGYNVTVWNADLLKKSV